LVALARRIRGTETFVSFPAMTEAGNDPVMTQRGSVAALYLHLTTRLDFTEYRRLRVGDLARTLHLERRTVGAALRILRDRGYIERGTRLMDVFTYRLLYSRRAV